MVFCWFSVWLSWFCFSGDLLSLGPYLKGLLGTIFFTFSWVLKQIQVVVRFLSFVWYFSRVLVFFSGDALFVAFCSLTKIGLLRIMLYLFLGFLSNSNLTFLGRAIQETGIGGVDGRFWSFCFWFRSSVFLLKVRNMSPTGVF